MSEFEDKTFTELQNEFEEAPKIRVVELAEFLEMELPQRELILSPWLPKAGLAMIHAYRGIGKTHMALGVAFAIAKGGDFLDWKAPIARNVLYIDGEMSAAVLQERLARIVLMFGDSKLPGRLRIITPDLQKMGIPDLSTLAGQELINEYITDDTDLVIVDNLSCLAPSIKENDSSDWATMQTWVLKLRVRGISVLLIHHSGKGGAQRGTSKKEDVLDTVITLARPKDYETSQGARFVITYEKSRGFFGDDARSFEAHLCNDGQDNFHWKTQTVEDSTYEKVIIMLKDDMTQKEIAAALEIDKSTVSRHATRARNENRL